VESVIPQLTRLTPLLHPESPLLGFDRWAFGGAVRIINAVVALLRANPGQAGWAVKNEFNGFAAHRFPHLSLADRAGHYAILSVVLMNAPPVILFTQSLIHNEMQSTSRGYKAQAINA
jgi:hypothetical protein